MRLHEYNVIGSAVRLDEIPPKFRNLKMLGRGATTIAFEKDPSTVLLFTRDSIKKDWLMHGIHLITKSQIIEPVKSHHIRGMSKFSLWVLEVPKLYPLSTENRRKVIKEIKDWVEISSKARNSSMIFRNGKIGTDKVKYFNIIYQEYSKQYPDSIIAPLIDFLTNYDPNQYAFDIDRRQFKQTIDGKIVLLDPIIDQELMDLFLANILKKRYR